jgi:hypothetical protein
MRKSTLLILLAGGLFFLSQAFGLTSKPAGEIPEEVHKVLMLSCYNCHATDAKNKDAREALNFEKWDDYRITKKIGLLGKICELVEKDKMPPAKYLASKPDRKLSDSQKKMICDWTVKESSDLMGGN